jgi:hypothetical protein
MESTTSDAGAQHVDSLSSTVGVDKEPSFIPSENDIAEHDIPLVVAGSTTQPPSKDESEDLKNGNAPSKNDDSQLLTSHGRSGIENEAKFWQKLAQEVLRDDETLEELQDKVGRSTYDTLAEIDLREGEKDKVRIRSVQAMMHIGFTEERVNKLETEVKKLRKDIQCLPDDFEVAKQLLNPVYLHELKRTTIQDFQVNEATNAIPHHLRPALELMLDDRSPLPTGHLSTERLRIRPKPLADHIGRICGHDTAAETPYLGNEKVAPSSIVFLRPFKLFITFETAIRASVQELEARIEKKAAETADSNGKSQQKKVPKDKKPEYDDQDLLIDLKLLINFFDVDLKTTFELRNKIKEGVATDIEYRDLWHLFQLGEDVMHKSNRRKVYRVINITVRTTLQTPLIAPPRVTTRMLTLCLGRP